MIELFKIADPVVRVVTGAISFNEFVGAGFHVPQFPSAAGVRGRQWLFIQYTIEDVNPVWAFVGLQINGESNGNDQLSLSTSDGGLSSISYTACHFPNNQTDGSIFFTWAGAGPSLIAGVFNYSILYRDVN